MMRITVHGARELRIYMRYLAKRMPNMMNKTSQEIIKEIKSKAKLNINSRVRWERTGNLAGSFIITKAGKHSYRLINSSPYAAYVEYGTSPHIIRNHLGYTWKGPDHMKSHSQTGGYYQHPGSRAMYFLRDAIDYVWGKAERNISRNADIAMRG